MPPSSPVSHVIRSAATAVVASCILAGALACSTESAAEAAGAEAAGAVAAAPAPDSAGAVSPSSSPASEASPDSATLPGAAGGAPTGAAPIGAATSAAGSAGGAGQGAVARSDSAAVSVSLPPGRSARDSMALVRAIRAGRRSTGWPVKGPEAAPGAVLPGKRIVAFYGNPLSKRMGVLGEYPVDEMLGKLDAEVKAWEKADPATPVVPALHLVVTVAQADPGRGNTYRLRMDSTLITKVYDWAKSRNGLLFLDVQTGWSTIQNELPRLRPWLENPDVHLGIDPEFNMHGDREGVKPGLKIGTYDAADINYVIRTLGGISTQKRIPPKILVVHRFTRKMVTNASGIRLDPHVQVVMDMDGWGPPWLKFDSYREFIVAEPVQYTGFKLFYKNDLRKGDKLLTPGELVQLHPAPHYIQYQ